MTTTRYGPDGSPLCAGCQHPAALRRRKHSHTPFCWCCTRCHLALRERANRPEADAGPYRGIAARARFGQTCESVAADPGHHRTKVGQDLHEERAIGAAARQGLRSKAAGLGGLSGRNDQRRARDPPRYAATMAGPFTVIDRDGRRVVVTVGTHARTAAGSFRGRARRLRASRSSRGGFTVTMAGPLARSPDPPVLLVGVPLLAGQVRHLHRPTARRQPSHHLQIRPRAPRLDLAGLVPLPQA